MLQTHTIHIQAEDVDGHVTDDFTYVIESTFSKYAGPVIDFLLFGANWIVDKVGDFIDWVNNTVTEALGYALEWLKEQVNKVMKFVKNQIEAIAAPILGGFHSIVQNLILNVINYQSGTMSDLLSTILPQEIYDVFDPITSFIQQYEDEINFAQSAIDLVMAVTNPISMAGFAIDIMGDMGVAPSLFAALNLEETVVDLLADNVGSLLFNVLDTQINFPSNFASDIDLPSINQMELFLTDLESYHPSSPLVNVARILFDKLILLDTTGGLQLSQTAGEIGIAMSFLAIIFGVVGIVIDFVNDQWSLFAKPGNIASIAGIVLTTVSFFTSMITSGSPVMNVFLTSVFTIMGVGLAFSSLSLYSDPIVSILGLIFTVVGAIINVIIMIEQA